ncbi:MAG: AraC family transcriptional regulator, partial [Erysipelotrichaceae bacterium]|nr:AraC family transcriptional regulator [Erysipelotrichaceae bacterium]
SISKSKCCNVFKEYANHSPIDFLNLYRLKVSTDKLKNSIDSIASIAHGIGFSQQSYYNRLFLREYGITPKEYRQQHQ